MYDLYECEPILRMPSNVKIKQCISNKCSNGITFIMYCDNNHLLYYHILNCGQQKQLNNNVVIRQIVLDESKGELRSMSLNESGSQLMIITSNSTIFIIPIKKLISRQNETLLKDDSIVIENCCLNNPTAIVWWKSLDQFNQMAIVGNDFGEISFINIKTKTEIGGTYVQNSVKSLNIIEDRNAVSLIIECKNETQFRLILEETRTKTLSKPLNESHINISDQFYFPCFITSSDEKETIGPNNCWNNKPSLIDMTNDDNIQETNTIMSTKIVYQNPLILCISETIFETEQFGQIILRLISNNEFDYTFASFSAKYLIPKQSSLPIKSVILTDRLCFVYTSNGCAIVSREFADSRKLAKINCIIQEFKFDNEEVIKCFKLSKSKTKSNNQLLDSFVIITSHCLYECRQKQSCQQIFNSIVTSATSEASLSIKAQRFASMLGFNISDLYENSADSCLERRQFASAVRFYQLAKTAQIKRIANFVSFGYFKEVITYIQLIFSSKCFELEDKDRMHFANIAINCLVQQLLENKIENQDKHILNTLKTFLKECLYYDESVVLRLLVEQGLFHLAQYCAKLRAQYGLLLRYLLKFDYIRAQAFDEKTFEIIMRTHFGDLMLNTTKCIPYLNCFTSPEITYSLILHKDLIARYLRFVVKLLPNIEMPFLIRLAVIFDPRRSATQLLLNRVLSQYKQTYLNTEEIEEQFVQKKDVLNIFMFITLMILRQNGSVGIFDQKFITIDPFIKDIENANKKTLLIETVQISAGLFHSAYIRNGCLYLWGKSQFGCLGLQTDDCTNVSKLVPSPTCLDLFKNDLSISVKAVSCGAHHTLVLTDFGVYTFGSSRFGQLGLGKDVILSRNPIIIKELINKDIIKIECGQYHSLAISSNGSLFTWGWGIFGQLGNGRIEDVYSPQLVEYFKGIVIVQAYAGYAHTIALDSNGIVYSFGNGTYGQLGLATNNKHIIPQKVSLLCEPISRISTKYFHCLALSEDKCSLYIWGSSPQAIRIQAHCLRKSRLNQPPQTTPTCVVPNQDYLKPIKVDTSNISDQIIKICAGSMHSLVLTSEGEVYSFGRGIDGQLGHSKVREIKIPSKIVALNDTDVVDIAAGSDYSLAVDKSGCIWGWGQNSDSQIGPKSSNLCSNSSIDDKNKKISIKTNRRFITFVAGGKNIEQLPIRINVLEDSETYCDSLNYSLDINAMKTSTRFSSVNDIHVLTDENSALFDHQILASMLAFYKHELDLNSVFNRCQNFKCFQMSAFVCELQKNLSKAFDFQLKALQTSHENKELKNFIALCTKIFYVFVKKTVDNLEELSKVFELFFQFWFENKLSIESLESLLDNCYKQDIKDSMFGISFFSCLKENENMKNKFSSYFLLEMVDFTIKTIANKPEKLFAYQTSIEKITSDIENVSFPAEKLWQNILAHFQCNNLSKSNNNIGVEIVPFEEEIILFTCNHYYGFNDFKLTVLPGFEKDINEINGIARNEIENMLDFYKDFDKELWDNVCPKCVISDVRAKLI